MKKKLKPIDPSTRARFMREKRCFELAHQERIDELASQLEDRVKMISVLEEALSNLKIEMMGMIKQASADEMVADAGLKAYREGEKEAEERLRKEKRCFDGFHNFGNGKKIVNMSLIQILNLFIALAKRPMSDGVYDKLTVLIPLDYEIQGGASRLELNKAVDSAIQAVFKKRPFIQ